MVFKELLSLWRDETALAGILQRFDEMLLTAKEMFRISTLPLEGEERESVDIQKKIIKMDGQLNTLHQVIRRDVVTHISVQGTGDIIPCLQLMSLTKDVERIGDYCKNVMEILSKAPAAIRGDPLLPDATYMRSKILIWFDQTKRAFDRMDKDLAKTTREETYLLQKECDRIVWNLAKNDPKRNAVAIALLIRFFKRIIAHLGNICTSVIMPLDKLDYFDS